MAYDATDYNKWLLTYRDNGRNLAGVARMHDVSRTTLTRVKKAGEPVEVTGGEEWDSYLDEIERQQVQRKRQAAAIEEREDIERRAAQIDQMLDTIYDKVIVGEGVEIKPEQFDKLMRLKFLIDNREQEKVEFMQMFAAKVFQIIAEVVDAQQFTVIKSRVMGVQKSEKDRLDLLPSGSE